MVIGGLLVSTFFTLAIIPTLYVIFEERFPRAPIALDHASAGPSADSTALAGRA